MNKIQVYVHGENSRDPKLIEVPENATVSDIINAYQATFPNAGNQEEIEIFLEDKEEPIHRDHSGDKTGIKKKDHFHCHRCKKIAVTIFYNGEDKQVHFSPSITAKVILKKAVHTFNINESDAGDYLLKLRQNFVIWVDQETAESSENHVLIRCAHHFDS
jgi:hypothetical protein